MNLTDRVESIISESLAHRGYDVVRVQLNGSRHKQLQIMIERQDDVAVSLDDCVEVSRCVSLLLDVEDPIEEAYSLEVSSPGLDRPLVKPRDFQRFMGHKAFVQTHDAVLGRKRFVGVITQADDKNIELNLDHPMEDGDTQIKMDYDAIRNAKLHLDD